MNEVNTLGAEEKEELQKRILNLPSLPNTVQGDGRYLMSLLKNFLEQATLQVNLANGFSAEEINPSQSAYPTPRDFFLSFSRLGGVFSWSRIADESNLAYYELRTDKNVGSAYNLLDRTTDNNSTKMPLSYSSTVYLYAVSKDAVASNPSELAYTKARPDAPTDISLTVTNEGTLITFLEIPLDCIGATIYIDNVPYTSTDNIFLLKEAPATIDKVEVAYFDQFGEGEHGVLYITLPDVTGFLVERNGSELDFYWDALNVYGVSYVVRVGREPDWGKGVELFKTKTNDKNRYIYPNTGEYYLMVKAVGEHGNYSRNAAFYFVGNDQDIHRNVILRFNQEDTLYAGNKLNMYYDPTVGGVTLEREATRGEYVFEVNLPQKYRARNWLEFNPLISLDSDTEWDDLNLQWDDLEHLAWAGELGDLETAEFRKQIAYPKENDILSLFDARLNGDLKAVTGETPIESKNANDFKPGRWASGLYMSQLTQLAYKLGKLPSDFTFSFCLKVLDGIDDTVIAVILDDKGHKLEIGYESYGNKFYVRCSDAVDIYLNNPLKHDRDWLTFAFTQGELTRALFIHSYGVNTTVSEEVKATPIDFNENTNLYCYPFLK